MFCCATLTPHVVAPSSARLSDVERVRDDVNVLRMAVSALVAERDSLRCDVGPSRSFALFSFGRRCLTWFFGVFTLFLR